MLRTLCLLVLFPILAVSSTNIAAEQVAPKESATLQSAPPPPGMDEEGVQAAPDTDTPVADANVDSDPDSIEPEMPDTRLVRDKASRAAEHREEDIRASSDSVIERQEGTDTVVEYREKGRLRMVRVIPQSGPAQIYMDNNNDGRLDRDLVDGPVSPVYFSIYEWN